MAVLSRRRKPVTAPEGDDDVRQVLEEQTAIVTPPRRRNKWLDRFGFYEPRRAPIRSTTRQAEALNIATSSPPTSPRGLLMGQDAETGQPVIHDPFQAYADKTISSPNVVVIGDVGKGKSSFLKTWAVLRQLLFDRRAIVIDKKRQGNEGEYAPTARALGVEPFRFILGGGGVRLNLLDPAISARDTGHNGPAGQIMLLRAVLAVALGRNITPREGKALRLAHESALLLARDKGRIAVIGDVVHTMLNPTEEAASAANATTEDVREWGRDAAYELERLMHDDLAGLVDGETSSEISLDKKLIVFDVSALPEDGPALQIVITLINTWMTNALRRDTQTVFVVEEGWHVVTGPSAKVFQRNWKVARGIGQANIVALHHLSDIPPDSPAIAMIKEAETVCVYGQAKKDDAEACVQLLNLPKTAVELLMDMPQGAFLMKVGNRNPVLVNHLRSDLEIALTDSDAAMLGQFATVDDDLADLSDPGEALESAAAR